MKASSDRPALPMRRRDFLCWTAVASLAAWGARLTDAASWGAAEPLSIGYVDGSESWDQLELSGRGEEAGTLRVLPATSLPSGDPALAETLVRVGVLGLYPQRPAGTDLPLEAHLDVITTPPSFASGTELQESFHYQAWSLRQESALVVSPRVRFGLWVNRVEGAAVALRVVTPPARGLVGRVERITAASTTGALRTARFTVASEPELPKLVRGVYLLGLTARAFSRPVDLPPTTDPVPVELVSLVLAVEHPVD
ncbi:MAG TPA: hypothetical protein VHQ65_15945 [Thermoanaerobaculia bacterium]|nr:hypothetical protein [Thermoanaerobaculia bacterium]